MFQERKGTQNPQDTVRASLAHPAGQTGAYRPVFQRLPVVSKEKLTE